MNAIFAILSTLGLLAAIAGVVVSLVMRSKYPKRATYAAIGFGLFALGSIISFIWPFATSSLLRAGSSSIGLYSALSALNSALNTLLRLGAFAMLLLALFRSDETPRQSGPPQQQYPGQQQYPQAPPQQQYPQAPQQQYPYQQPPQQYPGQGGQYPGQGY